MREVGNTVLLYCMDKLRREPLARHVETTPRPTVGYGVVPDCMRYMRLAQSYTAVNEKRIEAGIAWLLGDRLCRRPGKPIAISLDERLKRVGSVELRIVRICSRAPEQVLACRRSLPILPPGSEPDQTAPAATCAYPVVPRTPDVPPYPDVPRARHLRPGKRCLSWTRRRDRQLM